MTEEGINAVNCFLALKEERKNIKKNTIDMNDYFLYSGRQEYNNKLTYLIPDYRNKQEVFVKNDMTKYVLKNYRKI